jgi:hypothetical protein
VLEYEDPMLGPEGDNELSPEEEMALEIEEEMRRGAPAPAPSPRPAPAPAPAPVPLPPIPRPIIFQLPTWQQLAALGISAANRAQPRPAPRPAPAPAQQLQQAFSPAGAIQALTSSNTQRAECEARCREAARRKKQKRRERTVCYSGTFTETKRGTLKRRRRKVPCK